MKEISKHPGHLNGDKKNRNIVLSTSLLRTFLTSFLLASQCFGLEAYMSISPSQMDQHESAMLTITIEGTQNSRAPILPEIKGLSFSSSGTSSSFSMENGKVSAKILHQYLISAHKPGTYVIGPFNIAINNQTLPLKEVKLQVRASSNQPSKDSIKVVYAKLLASESSLYTHQIFDLEISICARSDVSLASEINLGGMPETGLKTGQFEELRTQQQRIGAHIYNIRRFRCAARPLTAGTFELTPTIRVHVIQQRQSRRDFFSWSGFPGLVKTKPYDLKVQTLVLKVHPTPKENQPSDFSGAVGTFQFEVEVSPTELNEGDPITLRMNIQGRGNMDTIRPPEISTKGHFKIYDPKLTVNKLDRSQTSGQKVYEQVLIPNHSKIKEFPVLNFSYFDVKKKKYQTIRRGPFPLKIYPVTNQAPHMVSMQNAPITQKKQLLGEDIVYLKPLPSSWKTGKATYWYRHPVFYGLQLIPLLAFASCFFVTHRKKQLKTDQAKARRLQAPKHARTAIRKAELAITQNDTTAFYEAVWNALTSYFGNRLNLAPGEVIPENVRNLLISQQVDQSLLEKVSTCFDECETFRYGVSATTQASRVELENKLDELNEVLKACEKIK